MATVATSLRPNLLAAAAPASSGKRLPLGIQLYSVRGELARDLPATLKAVADLGYEHVEFYAPYFEWEPAYAKTVRGLLDDHGLKAFTTHNHVESFTPGDGIKKAMELNKIIGSRHLILASAPKTTSSEEDWKRLCAQLSTAVETLRGQGMTAGFHNHASEWSLVGKDGKRVMDVIASETPKDFVLQFDVGTCMEAGADPIAWVKANPGRIKSVHLKDWAPGPDSEEKGFRVLFSEGTTPWKPLFAALEGVGGLEFYIMEQEGSRFSELETARRCMENWKKLRAET